MQTVQQVHSPFLLRQFSMGAISDVTSLSKLCYDSFGGK